MKKTVETPLPVVGEKCRVEGCKRPYRAKGYCNVHYRKWRHGELPHRRYKTCHAEGCHKPIVKGGVCEEHGKAKAAAVEAPPVVPEAPAPAKAPAPDAPPAS